MVGPHGQRMPAFGRGTATAGMRQRRMVGSGLQLMSAAPAAPAGVSDSVVVVKVKARQPQGTARRGRPEW
jgi:hypothetical protein